MAESERSLAIFLDFENLALGFQGRRERFDIARVLERLVEKGKIVAKKAYADWHRFSQFTHSLHEAAIELIEIPRRNQTGKNSADIRLCVDAMDLAYSKEHINTFVILSGDSDFSPLVSKLKELGKHVIGLGMQQSTSELLRDNCDEFIYYEDLGQASNLSPVMDSRLPEAKRKAFNLLIESLMALRRENKEVLWSSMIKDTMKRKKPSFNETYHGYRTFSELLEDAQTEGLLELETDKRSRTYVVTRFGNEMHHDAPVPGPAVAVPGPASAPAPGPALPAPAGSNGGEAGAPGKKKSRRRRRRNQQVAIPIPAGNGSPAPAQPREPAPAEQASAPRPATRPTKAEELVPAEPVIVAPPPAPAPAPEPHHAPGFHAGLDLEHPEHGRTPAPEPAAEEPAPKTAARGRKRTTKTTTPTPRPRGKTTKSASPRSKSGSTTKKENPAEDK